MLVLAAVAGMANVAQAQGIEINDTNFPDEKFRNHVSSTYDTDSDGSLGSDEIAAVTNIDVSNKNIANLEGIEHFTALTELSCSSNQLTTLDVSANTALTELYCYSNQLTALNVSKNTALTKLHCYNNQLTALNVSKNTALTNLKCYRNKLTVLDVSANTALKHLDCSNNQLTTLDVSANTALKWLFCGGNQLTTLDLSKNTALTELTCYSNQLTALDVSKNTALTWLNCEGNQLTALDVSANIALGSLLCYGNQIQADEMLALVNSLPTVTSGKFNVVDTQDRNEGNVITKAQVAIAKNKGWTVFGFNGIVVKEYAGVEEYVLTLGNPTNGTLTATPNGSVGEGTAVIITATPNEGYKLKALKAYKTGNESPTFAISENKFTMPPYDVTVEAEFEKKEDSTTGLRSAKLESLSTYPNPTTGQLWVSVPELAEGTAAEVLVYNAAGQLLQRVAARAVSTGSAAAYGRISIDLSGYPNGIYFIRVGNAVAKVLKQ